MPLDSAASHKYPYSSSCFMQEGRGFERRLSRSDDRHIAPCKSLHVSYARSMEKQGLRKVSQLWRDCAKRHVSRRQYDAPASEARTVNQFHGKAVRVAANPDDSNIPRFARCMLAKPFRVLQKRCKAERIAHGLVWQALF